MNYPPRWFEDAVFPGSVFAVCSVGAFVVLERIGMPEVFAVWFAFAAGMSATVAVLCAMDRIHARRDEREREALRRRAFREPDDPNGNEPPF